MKQPKFQIGQTVWIVKTERVEKQVQCPDCFGDKQLTVILGVASQVAVDCETCNNHGGWSGPWGTVSTYDYETSALETQISKVEFCNYSNSEPRWEYGTTSAYNPDEILTSKEEAEAAAQTVREKRISDEERDFNRKVKQDKKWAWHVKYHRAELKRAEEQVIYHTKKLAMSQSHVKEEKVSS